MPVRQSEVRIGGEITTVEGPFSRDENKAELKSLSVTERQREIIIDVFLEEGIRGHAIGLGEGNYQGTAALLDKNSKGELSIISGYLIEPQRRFANIINIYGSAKSDFNFIPVNVRALTANAVGPATYIKNAPKIPLNKEGFPDNKALTALLSKLPEPVRPQRRYSASGYGQAN